MSDDLEEDVLEGLLDVEDVWRVGESPQTLVEDVVEEGVLGVPENVLARVLDLQVLLFEFEDGLHLILIPITTQVDELPQGYFPTMDGKQ